ncbi:MAG: hypothetical protein V7K40_30055 [Nostoc sp.]|uniref:hypothetical protein n=1 Tax=Nostoc sp. TaxID=1180 RepID=UPI002FF793D7
MAKFVISVNDADDELKGYHSSTTASDGLLVEDLNEANIYLTKAEARTIAGRYQALNPDNDVSVKEVAVTVKLT